jgi:hypothetical protein
MIQVSNSESVIGNFRDINHLKTHLVQNPAIDIDGLVYTEIHAVPIDLVASVHQSRLVEKAFGNAKKSGQRNVTVANQISQRRLKIEMRKQQQAGKLPAGMNINAVPSHMLNAAQINTAVETQSKKATGSQRKKAAALKASARIGTTAEEEGQQGASDAVTDIINIAVNAPSADDEATIEELVKAFTASQLKEALGLDEKTRASKEELATKIIEKLQPVS